MSYAHIQSTAVEIPSPRLLPVVVVTIGVLAVIGFVLGLQAADDGGRTTVAGADLANAAALAGAPLASPIILNTAEAPPPAPAPVKTEEVKTAEAPTPTEAAPAPTAAVTAPVIVPPAAPVVAAPPATADALY